MLDSKCIAVGFIVSYDFSYLYDALPLVYHEADRILLTIDSQRLSLTGKPFVIESSFFEWIERWDTAQKVRWLQEPFFEEGQTPLEIILAMRNAMLEAMAPADWYVQLDPDEYFLDFAGFTQFLRQLPACSGVQVVLCKWKTLFKQVPGGFLAIGGKAETVPIAINTPKNTSERSHREAEFLQAPFYILHQSWARSISEIAQKIKNWSHTLDFNTTAFYREWLRCNNRNYRRYRFFHPIHPPLWPFLEYVAVENVTALVEHYRKNSPEERPMPRLPWHLRLIDRIRRVLS